ncbi:hypothetical protein C8Q80DRAFT_1266900 [Daedaleopsis nitida]|nr:hypothetical protein C8Q80DRAFT_1266900 [Daedaleopsis nitida]
MHVSVVIPDNGGIEQCTPVRFVWNGGQASYILSIVHPDDSQPLDQFINIAPRTILRRIKVPAGSRAQAVVADSTGLVARSVPFDVGAASNTTCLEKEITAFLPINGTASLTSNAPSSTSVATYPTSTSSSDGTSSSSRSPGAGEIAGIVLGCIALLFILGAVILCLRRRRRKRVVSAEDIYVSQYPLTSDTSHTLDPTDVKNPLVFSYTHPSTPPSRSPSLSSNTAPSAIDSAPASQNAELSGPVPLNPVPPALTSPPTPDSRRSRSIVLLTSSPKVSMDRPRTAQTTTSGMHRTFADQSLQGVNASLRASTFTGTSGRLLIQDTDGGVRLAGGPPSEMSDDLQSEVSILPPPYRPYR